MTPSTKPQLVPALSLKCPYCAQTHLRRPGSWLEFQVGCATCRYAFEREVGYFTGASWMINFTIIALIGFAIGFFMMSLTPKPDGLVIALTINGIIIATCFAIFPFGKALWLWMDHLFHPLTSEDEEYYVRRLATVAKAQSSRQPQ